jgi:lipoate-protein ligase A
MALDTWLLERCRSSGESGLRFYHWAEPTLSLGWHQRAWPEHWRSPLVQGQPLRLVRRPSGGRAVLHHGDLTYAIVTQSQLNQRRAVYCQLSRFLIAGFRQLQIELRFGQASRGYIGEPGCFSTATSADLVLPDGRKLIGSAQLWRGQAVLQHGSIQLQPDAQLCKHLFGSESPLPGSLDIAAATLIDCLRAAARDHFEIELLPLSLTTADWQAIEALEPQFHVEDIATPLV